MKRHTLTILLICSAIITAKSQSVDSYVLDNYNPQVINRVYNLVMKTNISGDKQKAIAAIFKNQDEAVATMIKNNEPKRSIDSINSIYNNSWKAVLSATDQFYYSSETAKDNKDLRYSYTLLLTAIQNKGQLNLSAPLVDYLLSKIDSLKIQEDQFYEQNPTQYFNSYSLQNQYINAVLSDAQYKILIEIKGKDKAWSRAKTDWNDLIEKGLATNLNADTVLAQFVKFYLAKDFATGRYEKNAVAKRKALQYIYDTEPVAMRKLYYARKYKNTQGNYKPSNFSQFLFAIKNTDKLELNESQVKDLLNKASDLEQLKTEAYAADSTKPYDSKKYECENMKQIITVTQYDNFLILKNLGRAKNIALNDWRELTQRNMITGHDKDSTVAELSNYYLQHQSIIDKNEDDKIRQADLLKDLYSNKPKALIALTKARLGTLNNTQGQGFIW